MLLVREAIPGRGGQVRGWMNCAALACYLLGRPYWVWTPHALYRRLLREPTVCRVDSRSLLRHDVSTLGIESTHVGDAVAGVTRCRANQLSGREGTLRSFGIDRSQDSADATQRLKNHRVVIPRGTMDQTKRDRTRAPRESCVNGEMVRAKEAVQVADC